MLWAVWIALGVGVLAIGFGAFTTVRGAIGAWRALRRLNRESASALGALTQSADRLASHPDPTGKLGPALASLARSRAQLAVLLAAIDEVRDSVERVTVFIPRK